MKIEFPITISIDPKGISFEFEESILDVLSIHQRKQMWTSLFIAAYRMVGELSGRQ